MFLQTNTHTYKHTCAYTSLLFFEDDWWILKSHLGHFLLDYVSNVLPIIKINTNNLKLIKIYFHPYGGESFVWCMNKILWRTDRCNLNNGTTVSPRLWNKLVSVGGWNMNPKARAGVSAHLKRWQLSYIMQCVPTF